jgi:hypothetical protein
MFAVDPARDGVRLYAGQHYAKIIAKYYRPGFTAVRGVDQPALFLCVRYQPFDGLGLRAHDGNYPVCGNGVAKAYIRKMDPVHNTRPRTCFRI